MKLPKVFGIDHHNGRIGVIQPNDKYAPVHTPPYKDKDKGYTVPAYTPLPQCHKVGPVRVFDFAGTRIYGGAGGEVDLSSVDAVIDLAGTNDPPKGPDKRGFAKAKALLAAAPVDYIHIPTKDWQAPEVGREVWEALIADMQDAAAKAGGTNLRKVLVCCQGGHGRTGTALAILAALTGQVPVGTDPVAWVRKRYCQKAVESNKQLQYVEDMTGMPVTAKPSKADWVSGSGYSGGGSSYVSSYTPPNTPYTPGKKGNDQFDKEFQQAMDRAEAMEKKGGYSGY